MLSWRSTWLILHRWLGLASGLVVFLVSITGCIWVFHEELSELFTSRKPGIPEVAQGAWTYRPSQLKALAEAAWPGSSAFAVAYQRGHAAEVDLEYGKDHGHAYFDPADGRLLGIEKHHSHDVEQRGFDFFAFALEGHRYLWLPPAIGEPIVNYGTLVFIVLLITGIILWWPRNKSGVKQRFRFVWRKSTGWKRKNYDLHNILGFYTVLIAFIIACTGLVIGLPWAARGVYWLTSGGKPFPIPTMPVSQHPPEHRHADIIRGVDSLFLLLHSRHPATFMCSVNYPSAEKPDDVVRFVLFQDWQRQYLDLVYTYDRYSLAPLPSFSDMHIGFGQLPLGKQLQRINYDLHVGTVSGLTTKTLAFFASLVCASLPVTGFFIWYNRKWGKKRKRTSERKP